MAFSFSCKDLVEGCDYVAQADTYEKAQEIVTGHYYQHHKFTETTPKLRDKVKDAIRES